MSPTLESGVQRRIESPEAGTNIHLLVKVDAVTDQVKRRLEDCGASIEMELPVQYLAVSIDEAHLEALCNIDEVVSVEIDSDGTVFSPGF